MKPWQKHRQSEGFVGDIHPKKMSWRATPPFDGKQLSLMGAKGH
jgi:hypothetical protein